tara:strand:- start:303 stop:875 length:573 start_codon:yes stop_codon:yes gene_type:complete
MFKSLKLFIVLLFVGFQTIAQNKENKWVVGAGIGVAKFASEDAKVVGDQFNFQLPKVNVSRYFYNGLTLDAGLSFNTINKIPSLFKNSVPYFSVDITTRYDFGKMNDNLVPYIAFGGSFVSVNSKAASTFNLGGGGTFWLNPRYGINVQLLFKNVLKDTATAKPHIYFSTGIVYSLKLRTLIPRLWNTTN